VLCPARRPSPSRRSPSRAHVGAACRRDAQRLPAVPRPNRDGTLSGFRLARDWEKRPPKLLWRRPVGLGWSAFAIASGRAITQEQRGQEEVVAAYDLASGRPLWVHADRVRFDSVIAGDGRARFRRSTAGACSRWARRGC
jgi:hypothetical protein